MAERRPVGLTRRPDFGTAEDRLLGLAPSESEAAQTAPGTSGASGLKETQPPARRRPLKVAGPIADELHNAVLFLRGRGRPELTQNELIDELLAAGLEQVRADLNGGQPFPVSVRRGRTGTL